MNTFLITLVVIGIVIAAMAIGVMFGRKPIAGSCGGMGAMGLEIRADYNGRSGVVYSTDIDS